MKAFKTALINLRRTPYQSLLAVFVITVTFFVAYTFSLTLAAASQVLHYFETSPQVIGFFELDATDSETEKIVSLMKTKNYVKEVQLVSKQEALKIYQEGNRDNPLLLELVTADILPASIEVSAYELINLEQIKNDLSSSAAIEEVVYQKDIISSLNSWTNSLRLIGIASTIILAIISFLVMMIIIGMKVASKKIAINIMQIIGATGWYIVAPFLIEGMIYGLLGSLLGFGGMYVLLLYLTPWVRDFLGNIITLPVPLEFFALQFGIGTLAGILLGSFASLVAASRMLKK